MDLKVFLLKTDRKTGTRTVGVIIRSAIPRAGYEKKLLPGIKVGLPGWQRAHVVGPGFGFEDKTIFYAPANFNLSYQAAGVERHIRDLYAIKAPDVEIRVTVEARPFKSTLKLEEITYKVEFVKAQKRYNFYELTLKISDAVKLEPKIEQSIIQGSAYHNIEDFLAKPSAPKRKETRRKRDSSPDEDHAEKRKRAPSPQKDAGMDSTTVSPNSRATVAKTVGEVHSKTDARATNRMTAQTRIKNLTQLIKYGQTAQSAAQRYRSVAHKWSFRLGVISSFLDKATGAIETVLTAQRTARRLAGIELSENAKLALELSQNAEITYLDTNSILNTLLDPDFADDFFTSLETTDRTEILFVKEPLYDFKNYVKEVKPGTINIIPKLREKIVLLKIVKHKMSNLLKNEKYLATTTALYVGMGGDTATIILGIAQLKVDCEHMINFLQSALDWHLRTLPLLESIEDHSSYFEQQVADRVAYLSKHNLWTGPGISFTN